jgi:hypothetical protein
MLVPLIAVVGAAIAIGIGLAVGQFRFGGTLGIEVNHNNDNTASVAGKRAIQIVNAEAFDPFGSGGEHDEEAPLAHDGDPSTFWQTENYTELNLAPKPGVGLLFDLGQPEEVSGFRLQTTIPGFTFQIRVGDDSDALADSTGPDFTARDDMQESIRPVKGRYVLVWITGVVRTDDGNRATIGEFRVLGG